MPVAHVACGGSHVMAILEDSSIVVWGSNFFGELGLGYYGVRPGNFRPSVLPIPEGLTVASLGSLETHSFVVTSEGHLYTWGYGSEGRLGMTFMRLNTPTHVEGFVARVPGWDTEWAEIFKWLFLGRKSRLSVLSLIHI